MAKSPGTPFPASSQDPGATETEAAPSPPDQPPADQATPAEKSESMPTEPKKPDPTRYGDWEKNGRCIDF